MEIVTFFNFAAHKVQYMHFARQGKKWYNFYGYKDVRHLLSNKSSSLAFKDFPCHKIIQKYNNTGQLQNWYKLIFLNSSNTPDTSEPTCRLWRPHNKFRLWLKRNGLGKGCGNLDKVR